MDCPTCGCLGFSSPQHWEELQGRPTKVSPAREKHEIEQSAEAGCRFCSLILQASKLLRTCSFNPPVSIHIYQSSPAQIHSLHPDEFYDVVEIYAIFDGQNTSLPRLAEDVPSRTDSQSSLCFFQDSYKACRQDHEECRQKQIYLPKRVLQIKGPTFKLLESEPHQVGAYAALSYCWGSWSSKMLTTDNIAQLKKEIDPQSIHNCFGDAIRIARMLEIPYLWIDSFCIIQDDDADWEAESGKMAEVYENAAIVISASLAKNPHDSIFTEKDKYFSEIMLEFGPGHPYSSVTFKARRKIAVGIHATLPRSGPQDPLELRAWAMQERELATRYLSFTGAELQWECKRLRICECHKATWAPAKKLDDLEAVLDQDSKSPFHEWHTIVEDYTSRNLTVLDDRLPALGGLATRFAGLLNTNYVAGMWEEHLLEDLSWQRDVRRPLQPMLQYLAPSFSWASVSVPVDYQPARDSYPGTRIYHSIVTEVQVLMKTTDQLFGRVTSGFLDIQGPTKIAELSSTDVIDAKSYRLAIDGFIFEPNTFQPADCEFAVDVLSVSFTITSENDQMEGNGSWLGRSTQAVSGPVMGKILLLSLFSIVHENYSYEIFLLLGRSITTPRAYERLGVGTGKLYGGGSSITLSSQAVRPFDWLQSCAAAQAREVAPSKTMRLRIV